MTQYGVRVQKGMTADSVEEALAVGKKLKDEGAFELVVKSQIHAGGRGKGYFKETGFKGGVKISEDPAKIAEYTGEMLGKHLITKQTPPEGQMVRKVLVHEGLQFDEEKYFAIVMDRDTRGPMLLVSPQGGMDIEEVAEKTPEALKKIPIDFTAGINDEQATEAANFVGLNKTPEILSDSVQQIKNLYKMFTALDATQVEINPLVLAKNGKVYCVDSKINFDDNAAFRQKDIFAQRDTSMEDPREVAASKFNLNYIGLDGNIGCLVNGAGLAMATMDIIQLYGGSPANFLDVGGSASAKQVWYYFWHLSPRLNDFFFSHVPHFFNLFSFLPYNSSLHHLHPLYNTHSYSIIPNHDMKTTIPTIQHKKQSPKHDFFQFSSSSLPHTGWRSFQDLDLWP